MKKIIIAETLQSSIENDQSVFKRSAVSVFTAGTNDRILEIHRAEKADLIISRMDLPGMGSEQLYALIRTDPELRAVSTILCCGGTPTAKEAAQRCKPNTLLTLPVDHAKIEQAARDLLQISSRESYRVLLSIQIEGNSKERAFFCKSENISASGLLLETEKDLVKGDKIICSFFLPGSHRITVNGDVVREIDQKQPAAGKQYGVKFTKVSLQDKLAIEQFVKMKSQKAR